MGLGSASQYAYSPGDKAKANSRLLRDRDPVICAYDLAKFGGGIVVDIM
jgi:hypothetical protein